MDNKFDKIISAEQKAFNIDFKRIWEYRDLVFILVRRDFVTYYKQTILGPLWYLVQPMVNAIAYMIIFGNLAKMGTDGIPKVLFYFSGTMLWSFFCMNLTKTSETFRSNKEVFGKVYFPRIIVPISSTIGLVINLMLQYAFFILLYVIHLFLGVNISVSWKVLLVPIVLVWIAMQSSGLGMIVAAFTTRYRDLAMVLSFALSLFMYITPVAYPLSEVSGGLRLVFYINPMTSPIEFFRYCYFSTELPPTLAILISVAVTIMLFFVGALFFSKNEKTFIDMI